jgi:ATP-binding cassette subfamily F protein 1
MAVIWLETYILRWKNTLLIVSHDQGFLNSVCTDMIHIYQTKLVYYRGNYDAFKHQFTESVSQARKTYEKQQKMIKATKEQKGKKDEKNKAAKKAKEDSKVLRNR